MENKTPYFITIPGYIREHEKLSPNAKLLFGDIAALCNSKGHCWATNSYLAKAAGVDKNTISKLVSLLEECGLIKSEVIRAENGEITSRIIKISIPVNENGVTPIPEKGKENNTLLNIKEDTTIVSAIAPKNDRVNWDNPKSDLQAFMGYYIKLCMPVIYSNADRQQVAGFFKMYGKLFSSMLATAGSVDVAQMALDEAISFYKGKGYTWGLKALSTNWGEFVNCAMEKKRRV